MILKFLKRLSSFVAIMMLIHTIGAILFASSDYFLCWLFNNNCGRYSLPYRFIFYLSVYLMLSLYTGFFLIILILLVAKSKYNLSLRNSIIMGCVCGGVFALNTSHLIWSLYINSPEKEYRYVIVVLITMLLSSYIIHLFRKII